MFGRLLLPALNIKKTLGYTVLLPPKNLSCVTSQFYQFTTGTGFLAKKSKPLIQKAVKEKKSKRKSQIFKSLSNGFRLKLNP